MEYQKIINLLDNTSNQPSKFRTKKLGWHTNDDACGTFNTTSEIKFKTTMLKSNLCDYSNAYILVKGTISVANTAAVDVNANNGNAKVIFKNCTPFTVCISQIHNTQVGNVKNNDVVR